MAFHVIFTDQSQLSNFDRITMHFIQSGKIKCVNNFCFYLYYMIYLIEFLITTFITMEILNLALVLILNIKCYFTVFGHHNVVPIVYTFRTYFVSASSWYHIYLNSPAFLEDAEINTICLRSIVINDHIESYLCFWSNRNITIQTILCCICPWICWHPRSTTLRTDILTETTTLSLIRCFAFN